MIHKRQEAKIMNWYNNLSSASFSEWFESQIHDREGLWMSVWKISRN